MSTENGTPKPTPLGGASVLPPMETGPPEPKGTDTQRKGGGSNSASRRPKGKRKAAQNGAAERWRKFNDLVDMGMRELSNAELRVYLLLFRDARGGTARTAQADMARRAGLSDRQIRRGIEGLEAKGLLEIVQRGKLSGGPSVYRVLPPGEPGG